MPFRSTACLVIGGAGNLGGFIVRTLLDRKYTVSSFDLVPYGGHGAESVKSHTGDVTDQAALEAAICLLYTSPSPRD